MTSIPRLLTLVVMIFTREDGQEIRVIDGFRDRVLTYRKSVSPRSAWGDEDFGVAAEKRIKRGRKLIGKIEERFGPLDNSRILEIGCGDGLNTALIGRQGAKRAVGIDLDLRVGRGGERGEAVRRLMTEIVKKMNVGEDYNRWLDNIPVELSIMNATRMDFPDDSFDLAISRSVLEHIHPIEDLFPEIARVVRPGGMVYHEIDPFFWIRGCHKRGLVDIPWAHARLTLDDFRRFVAETEGEGMADKRLERLTTLNRLTIRDWRSLISNDAFEIAEWTESTSTFAQEVYNEYPDVSATLLPGVEPGDLLTNRIAVWLRRRDN